MTDNELIHAPVESQASAIRDMRAGFLSMSVENMTTALGEYDQRRKLFRQWLKEKLVPGVHYGFPPGCEPNEKEINGEKHYGVWSKGGVKFYPAKQWTPKPSLYKPTADMLAELLGLRAEFTADLDAWQQLGSPANTFVTRCRLVSLTSGEVIGEGRGCRKVGQRGGDENNALKMSQKAAKVDAIINALGISDLFTQDMDEPPDDPPQYANPEPTPNAPQAAPRGDRVVQSDYTAVGAEWKRMRAKHDLPTKKDDWADFFEGATGKPRDDAYDHTQWSLADLESLRTAIAREMHPGELFPDGGAEAYQ